MVFVFFLFASQREGLTPLDFRVFVFFFQRKLFLVLFVAVESVGGNKFENFPKSPSWTGTHVGFLMERCIPWKVTWWMIVLSSSVKSSFHFPRDRKVGATACFLQIPFDSNMLPIYLRSTERSRLLALYPEKH